LSSWYFDIIKDSLYCDDANNDNRRTVQTVLYTILKSYLAVLAPIIPHTAEEVYTNFNIADKKESVFLENWIDDFDLEFAKVNEKKWKQFSNLRSIAYAKLEKLRAEKIINKNNQALVEIEFNNEFNFTQEELAKYFNVAKVIIKNSSSDTVNVEVANANMVRCERCWNYFEAGEINQEQLCERCAKAIKKI
jgi:isoleucyl-tRNA synthetase